MLRIHFKGLLEGDFGVKLGIFGVSAWLIDRDTNFTLGEHEILASHVAIADDDLLVDKVPAEHGLGEDQVVLGVDALRQERVREELHEFGLASLRLRVLRSHKFFERLATRVESPVEDRASLSLQIGGVRGSLGTRLAEDTVVKFTLADLSKGEPELLHGLEIAFLVDGFAAAERALQIVRVVHVQRKGGSALLVESEATVVEH